MAPSSDTPGVDSPDEDELPGLEHHPSDDSDDEREVEAGNVDPVLKAITDDIAEGLSSRLRRYGTTGIDQSRTTFGRCEDLLADFIATLGQFPGLHIFSLESYYQPLISAIANAIHTHGPSDLSIQSALAFLTSSITLANETARLRGDAMSSIDGIRADIVRNAADNERRLRSFAGLQQLEVLKDACEREIRNVELANQTRLTTLEGADRANARQLEELQRRLDEAIGDLAHRVEYLEQRGLQSDSSSATTNFPESDDTPSSVDTPRQSTTLVLPRSLADPALLQSLLNLLDGKLPGEDDLTFRRRNEAGIRQLFEASRSPTPSSAQQLYHICHSLPISLCRRVCSSGTLPIQSSPTGRNTHPATVLRWC